MISAPLSPPSLQKKVNEKRNFIISAPRSLAKEKKKKPTSYPPPSPLRKKRRIVYVIFAPRPLGKKTRRRKDPRHICPQTPWKKKRQKSTSYLPPDTSQLRNFSPTAVQLCFNDHNYSTPQQTLNRRIMVAS